VLCGCCVLPPRLPNSPPAGLFCVVAAPGFEKRPPAVFVVPGAEVELVVCGFAPPLLDEISVSDFVQAVCEWLLRLQLEWRSTGWSQQGKRRRQGPGSEWRTDNKELAEPVLMDRPPVEALGANMLECDGQWHLESRINQEAAIRTGPGNGFAEPTIYYVLRVYFIHHQHTHCYTISFEASYDGGGMFSYLNHINFLRQYPSGREHGRCRRDQLGDGWVVARFVGV
jgi:hypothetical protein